MISLRARYAYPKDEYGYIVVPVTEDILIRSKNRSNDQGVNSPGYPTCEQIYIIPFDQNVCDICQP